ncbi:complement receptor type 1-like [Alligator mississippiensis]|uniref:Complement receptor type 1-like n=2 Tax=Alligator mississippiensis TaxID=8496 RepID=A0A151MUU1_ALLMI|nr:complement receptor type 1-like [Alligator mississippiensis]
MNGIWSGPSPECKVVSCLNPEVQNGKKLTGFGPHYTYRDTVTFECDTGYALNGSRLIQCEANSAWSPPVPTCDLRHCGPPPRVNFTEANGTADKSYPVGTTLVYHCCPGYTVTGGEPQTITCLATAAWSSAPKSCFSKSCEIPVLQNGKIDSKAGVQLGGTANFSCDKGYTLEGPKSVKCVVSGSNVVWHQPIPKCIRERNTATTIAMGSISLLLALLVLHL